VGVVVGTIKCESGLHADKTPSLKVYDDGSVHCFVCGYNVSNYAAPVLVKREPENLGEKYAYIEGLTRQSHRGLTFRYDNRGYFVEWPGKDYYKLRLWCPKDGEPKYIGARGHRKPWFELIATRCGNHNEEDISILRPQEAIIVEGEINALSIKEALPEAQVISPGSATQFYDNEAKRNIPKLSVYKTLLVLVDDDQAGHKAALEFYKLAKPHCLDIRIKLMEEDANAVLCKEDGKQKLKEIILGM
jgi:DNA primase